MSITVSPVLTTFAVNPEIPCVRRRASPIATINAVDFDHGLDGTSYHDTTTGNTPNQYRPNVDVDMAVTTDTTNPGSGYEVTTTASGEWLRYTINTATTGVYTLSARVQSTTAGAKFHYEIDGTAVTSSITIPSSASWQTVTQANISLPSGTHILRLVFDANNTGGNAGNWNSFSFALTGAIQPPAAPASLAASAISTGIKLTWADVTGETGFGNRAIGRRVNRMDANRHDRDQHPYLHRRHGCSSAPPYFYRVRAPPAALATRATPTSPTRLRSAAAP